MATALTEEQIERLTQLAEDYPNFKADLADLRTRLDQGDDRKELRQEFDELKARLNDAIKERTDHAPRPEPFRPAVPKPGRDDKPDDDSGFFRFAPHRVFQDED